MKHIVASKSYKFVYNYCVQSQCHYGPVILFLTTLLPPPHKPRIPVSPLGNSRLQVIRIYVVPPENILQTLEIPLKLHPSFFSTIRLM